MSRDIDLLVQPEAISQAAKLLLKLGYAPQLPCHPPAVANWHRRSKESVWAGPSGHVLELHSRLNDNPGLMRQVTAQSPSRLVQVASGILLPTLQEPALLAYLAVHGASSAWFRLKWLADFANLLRGRTTAELNMIHQTMLALGSGRASGLALLLAQRVFALPIAPELQAQLEADPRVRWLAGESLRQLEVKAEPTQRLLGTVGIHLAQTLIGYGWSFPLHEGQRRLAEVVGRKLIRG